MLCALALCMQRVANWLRIQSQAVLDLNDRFYSERSLGERFALCVVLLLAFDFVGSGASKKDLFFFVIASVPFDTPYFHCRKQAGKQASRQGRKPCKQASMQAGKEGSQASMRGSKCRFATNGVYVFHTLVR